jgi:hypothetical protein
MAYRNMRIILPVGACPPPTVFRRRSDLGRSLNSGSLSMTGDLLGRCPHARRAGWDIIAGLRLLGGTVISDGLIVAEGAEASGHERPDLEARRPAWRTCTSR